MPDDHLTCLDQMALLAISAARTAKKPPTLADLVKDLGAIVSSSNETQAHRLVEGILARTIRQGWVERVDPPKAPQVARFRLNEAGAEALKSCFKGGIPGGTWAQLSLTVLPGQSLPNYDNGGSRDFGHLRAHVLAHALGRTDAIQFAKTEAEMLNSLAASIVGARNADPDTIQKTMVRTWLLSAPSAAAFLEDDDAEIVTARYPDKKPSTAKRRSKAPSDGDAPAPAKARSKKTSDVKPSDAPRRKPTKKTTEVSIEEFAKAVHSAARQADGRVGRKAFINRVWQVFAEQPIAHGYDFNKFSLRLIEANRNHLVRLSRADLPQSLPADDLRESAIPVLSDNVHFVTIEDEA